MKPISLLWINLLSPPKIKSLWDFSRSRISTYHDLVRVLFGKAFFRQTNQNGFAWPNLRISCEIIVRKSRNSLAMGLDPITSSFGGLVKRLLSSLRLCCWLWIDFDQCRTLELRSWGVKLECGFPVQAENCSWACKMELILATLVKKVNHICPLSTSESIIFKRY